MKLVLIGDNSLSIRKVRNDELHDLVDNNEFIELKNILEYSEFEVEIKNVENPLYLQFDGPEDYVKLLWDRDNTMYKIMED